MFSGLSAQFTTKEQRPADEVVVADARGEDGACLGANGEMIVDLEEPSDEAAVDADGRKSP